MCVKCRMYLNKAGLVVACCVPYVTAPSRGPYAAKRDKFSICLSYLIQTQSLRRMSSTHTSQPCITTNIFMNEASKHYGERGGDKGVMCWWW